ncbi:hypothetical protein OH768_44250 [Streptomyces sp. NBC_01622]|uniref:hypothetical protein n=1 Tax=Streptomyces sp. NBC_01622 TaxID=2975903 RepID=UPI0038643A2A|nr:hypothetical protein OH768_44250 [Streptomyces sp. NBC_01622]
MKNDQPTAAADGTSAGNMASHTATGESPVTTLAEARAPWNQLREALRTILGDQPSPHLVRTTARRISAEVQMTADSVLQEREARP